MPHNRSGVVQDFLSIDDGATAHRFRKTPAVSRRRARDAHRRTSRFRSRSLLRRVNTSRRSTSGRASSFSSANTIARARTSIAHARRLPSGSASPRSCCTAASTPTRPVTSSGARDLLTRAVDQGAPSDEALVLLERMDRLEGTGFDAAALSQDACRRGAWCPTRRHRATAAHMAVGHRGAGACRGGRGVYFGAAPALSWLVDVPAPRPFDRTGCREPLPMVRTADTLLDRARELYAGGHLHDALRLLDRIGIADPVRAGGRSASSRYSARAACVSLRGYAAHRRRVGDASR